MLPVRLCPWCSESFRPHPRLANRQKCCGSPDYWRNYRAAPLKTESLRTLFRHRRLSKKLLRVHPHLLRHTFCTNMIKQGMSLPVVQKLMGHSDIEVTMLYVLKSGANFVGNIRLDQN